jgi:hypothetical protein
MKGWAVVAAVFVGGFIVRGIREAKYDEYESRQSYLESLLDDSQWDHGENDPRTRAGRAKLERLEAWGQLGFLRQVVTPVPRED